MMRLLIAALFVICQGQAATRLYLRDLAPTSNPTAGEKSTALPVGTFAECGLAERALRTNKGAAQVTASCFSLNQTAHQDLILQRFSSEALDPQTINANTWILAVATDEGNGNANTFTIASVYVWRPSTSAVVGFLYDSDTALGVEWSISPDGQVLSLGGSAVTVTKDDILVISFWFHAVQGMAVNYENRLHYNGTTDVIETTNSDAASYLETPQNLVFATTGTAPRRRIHIMLLLPIWLIGLLRARKYMILSALITVSAIGQPTNVRVTGVTNTQALIEYTAPDAAACTLEVSESSTYSPVVFDVDTAKFAGSSSDGRAGNVTNGRARIFVAGKRAAEIAADGRFYSRALQALTPHYFRITCGASATGTFTTTNIGNGNTFPDPISIDSAGIYAYPTVDWSGAGATGNNLAPQKIIDHQTGALIRRITKPQTSADNNESNVVSDNPVLGGAGWTTPDSARVDDTNNATYVGDAARNWLWIRFTPPIGLQACSHSRECMLRQMDYATATFKGRMSAGAGEDLKFEYCLTIDGANCWSALKEQAITTTEAPYTLGTTTPVLDFWRPTTYAETLSANDQAQRTGNVDIAASGVVNWVSGHQFSMRWGNGSTIVINAVRYVISAVNSPKKLTLTTSPATASNVAYTARNFGLLVRKKTATGDTLFIQYVSSNTGTSPGNQSESAGSFDACAPVTVTRAGDGQVGYHCALSTYTTSALYFVGKDTGDAAFLGFIGHEKANPDGWALAACGAYGSSAVWDKTDPNTFYCTMGGLNNKLILTKATYTGPNTDIAAGYIPAAQLTLTNLTPGAFDVDSLANTRDSRYTPARFICNSYSRHDKYVMLLCTTEQAVGSGLTDTLGYILLADPTLGVASAGNNIIVAAVPTWDTYPLRFCALHAIIGVNSGNWVAATFNQGSESSTTGGSGPWQTDIVTTAMEAIPSVTCPANDVGISGVNCSTVTVGGEIFDPGPCLVANCPSYPETSARGFFGNAKINDVFLIQTELVQLLAKAGDSWTFARGRFGTTAAGHAVGQVFKEQCPQDYAAPSTGGTALINILGDILFANPAPFNSSRNWSSFHGDISPTRAFGILDNGTVYNIQNNTTSGNFCTGLPQPQCFGAFSGANLGAVGTSYATSGGAFKIIDWARFDGAGSLDYNVTDIHPSCHQANAVGVEQEWCVDFSYQNGTGNAMGSTNGIANVTGDLWRMGTIYELYRKRLGTQAFCGERPLRDVSPTVLVGTAGDNYKYCVVEAVGECQAGSAVGQIYFNCPNLTETVVGVTSQCGYGSSAGGWYDAASNPVNWGCIFGGSPRFDRIVQYGIGKNDENSVTSRNLSNGFYRKQAISPNTSAAIPTPGGEWALWPGLWLDGQRNEVMAVKIPPQPAHDTVQRYLFIRVALRLQPPSGVDNAIVEFGYNTKMECTSRIEACVKGNQGGTDYDFSGVAVTGKPCSTGCTIEIPAIPQRMVYYRWKYRNAGGVVLYTSSIHVVASP